MHPRALLLATLLGASPLPTLAADGLNLARVADTWRADAAREDSLPPVVARALAAPASAAAQGGMRWVADFSLPNSSARGDGPLLGTQGFDATHRALRRSPTLQIGARWSF